MFLDNIFAKDKSLLLETTTQRYITICFLLPSRFELEITSRKPVVITTSPRQHIKTQRICFKKTMLNDCCLSLSKNLNLLIRELLEYWAFTIQFLQQLAYQSRDFLRTRNLRDSRRVLNSFILCRLKLRRRRPSSYCSSNDFSLLISSRFLIVFTSSIVPIRIIFPFVFLLLLNNLLHFYYIFYLYF